jgi:hypothetical protein
MPILRSENIKVIAMMYTYAAGLDPTVDSEERREFIKEAELKVIEIEKRFKRS